MTEKYSSGPFIKDEVIVQLGKDDDAEKDCYEWYGFNCISGFYEMSSGYYCAHNYCSPQCEYCLHLCCVKYGSIEDQRKFNRNVVLAGEIELKYLIPNNKKEKAALNKILRRIKKFPRKRLFKFSNRRSLAFRVR